MERSEYATMFRVEETHWWYSALHRLIVQALEAELPDWRNKEILDVGCGTGAILKRLGNPDRNFGIDLAHVIQFGSEDRGRRHSRGQHPANRHRRGCERIWIPAQRRCVGGVGHRRSAAEPY